MFSQIAIVGPGLRADQCDDSMIVNGRGSDESFS
jgi:hypothetical protein